MKRKYLIYIVFLILLLSCISCLKAPANQTEDIPPTAELLTPITTSTDLLGTPTIAPTYTAETARLTTQCVDVEKQRPKGFTSTGIVVLDRVNNGGPYKGDHLLLDMTTGKTKKFNGEREGQLDHIVSPNKMLMAFEGLIFSPEGNVVENALIVADATGNNLNVIPWEEEWLLLLTWLDNEHLVIPLRLNPEEDYGKKPLALLVLNPFRGERRILKPDFPGLSDVPLSTVSDWKGWSGVVYDPTVSSAVYPHPIENNESMYTYVIWDMSSQKLVASLEDIFSANSYDPFPLPQWSPDGSQFVFRSGIRTLHGIKYDLYGVKLNGQIEQLTYLSPTALLQDSNLSWSPNGRYIALFLNNWGGYDEKAARVAILDTETLNVTDYCISVTYRGEGYGGRNPSPAIWSPDNKQFLVVDWYERDHQRLILVDIEVNIAVEIPENMEPVGWMVAP